MPSLKKQFPWWKPYLRRFLITPTVLPRMDYLIALSRTFCGKTSWEWCRVKKQPNENSEIWKLRNGIIKLRFHAPGADAEEGAGAGADADNIMRLFPCCGRGRGWGFGDMGTLRLGNIGTLDIGTLGHGPGRWERWDTRTLRHGTLGMYPRPAGRVLHAGPWNMQSQIKSRKWNPKSLLKKRVTAGLVWQCHTEKTHLDPPYPFFRW